MSEDDERWFQDLRETLEHAYLQADDPRGQSGFRGDEARWERGRRVIADAIERDGSLLDIGCANGLLMQSLMEWAAARGFLIEPYGLDISCELVRLAQSRVPKWADRIWSGNGLTWVPPQRFNYVRTELVYVPETRREEYVRRLLRDVVSPAGRLIVCSYGSSRRPEPRVAQIRDVLEGWGIPVAGESESADFNGVVITRVAWVDAGAAQSTISERRKSRSRTQPE